MRPISVARTRSLALFVATLLATSSVSLGAQDVHPADYPQADIEYGARIYAAQCSTCHLPTGDGIAGVNLRSGRFRNVSRDQDLARIITTGIPQTAMPPFKFDASEVSGLIAYLRNMNTFDPASVKPGNPRRGQAVFESKGRCGTCHRVNGKGPRSAPDLSNVGALRSAGSLQRSLADPSSQMMPINRPVRAVDKRRQGHQRPPAQRRHLLGAADRRSGAPPVVGEGGPARIHDSRDVAMPSFKDTLSADELSDVVAYLLSLKGL